MGERDRTLDVSKGLGMILVIYGHSMPIGLYKLIASFHVPLFFLVSGCVESLVFNKDDTNYWQYFKKNLYSLMIPYYLYGGVDLLVYILVSSDLFTPEHNLLRQVIYYLIGQRCIDHYYFTGALWFLSLLFVIKIIFRLIEKSFNIFLKSIIYFGIVISSFLFLKYNQTLPMNIDLLPYCFPFYILGYYGYKPFKYKLINIKWYNCIKICSLLIVCNAIIAYFGIVDVFSKQFGNNLLFYFIGGTSGGLMTIIVSQILSKKESLLTKSISFIGQNSLYYLVFHQQLIIHPINSIGFIFKYRILNFIVRFIPAISLSSLFAIIMSYQKNRFSNKPTTDTKK